MFRKQFGGKGLIDIKVGYANGIPTIGNVNYEKVCSGSTEFVEAVQLSYEPENLQLEANLDIFFRMHDPTTVNSQGPDKGTQYRSAIMTHDDKDNKVAWEIKQKMQAEWYPGHQIASFPVLIQPFILVIMPLLKILPKNRMVRGSNTCSTVARLALSFVVLGPLMDESAILEPYLSMMSPRSVKVLGAVAGGLWVPLSNSVSESESESVVESSSEVFALSKSFPVILGPVGSPSTAFSPSKLLNGAKLLPISITTSGRKSTSSQ